eukprot:4428156-Amphidinium_carterae.2
MTAWISWKRKNWGGFVLWSGLLQGDPASSLLFVLALDPWVRYCCSRMPTPVSIEFPTKLSVNG